MIFEDMINKCVLGKCPNKLKLIPDESIDLTITSPPYDNLRSNYESIFDFKNTAKQLFRITKTGGVVVWVVADATIKGSESLTSAKQAIYFKEKCGFSLHDTMIYMKTNPMPMNHNRYEQTWEYMFVFSKGKPATFNPLLCPIQKSNVREDAHHTRNHKRGNTKRGHNSHKIKSNVWEYKVGYMQSSKDKEAFDHPAIFPEQLAADHISTWTNLNDLVFDPFCGSGTTCKMALLAGRRFIGVDCEPAFVDLANKRVNKTRDGLSNNNQGLDLAGLKKSEIEISIS